MGNKIINTIVIENQEGEKFNLFSINDSDNHQTSSEIVRELALMKYPFQVYNYMKSLNIDISCHISTVINKCWKVIYTDNGMEFKSPKEICLIPLQLIDYSDKNNKETVSVYYYLKSINKIFIKFSYKAVDYYSFIQPDRIGRLNIFIDRYNGGEISFDCNYDNIDNIDMSRDPKEFFRENKKITHDFLIKQIKKLESYPHPIDITLPE